MHGREPQNLPNISAWSKVSDVTPRDSAAECVKKLHCSRALAHGPSILLLDEPTAGLDITSARTVRKLVNQLKTEGGTVVYSTHQLSEAQQVCDRIVIVHNGEIRADGPPQELLENTGTDTLEEAYVSLTKDTARPRQEDDSKEGRFTGLWRSFFTPKPPKMPDRGESDE
jgi:ABC-type multidrug transport system ATPase subunit